MPAAVRRPNSTKRSPHQFGAKSGLPGLKDAFLAVLCSGGVIRDACEAAGIARTTAYEWRENDEAFAAAWQHAVDEGTDLLEREALRRARDGVEEPVFYQGAECGRVTRHSDALMQFMLRGRRPTVFNTDRVEHSGPGGKPIDHSMTVEFVAAKDSKKGGR